jgi:class 3 adenylate cyclase
MRIGIHTGPVVAGIIGTHKFIYDVWGDTVNVAARLESHGAPGRVHASASTYLKLRDKFRFQPRGPLELKGIGLVETYFLTGRTGAA